jgi:hypothetical protein
MTGISNVAIIDGLGNLQTAIVAKDANNNIAPAHTLVDANGNYIAILPTSQPDTRQTSQTLNLTGANNAFSIALSNATATVGMQITGLTGSGATLAIEASNDNGTTWNSKNALVPLSEGIISTSLTTDSSIKINGSGHTNLRLRVSTTGTGNASISYSATPATGVVSLGASIPPGNNVIGKAQLVDGSNNAVIYFNGSVGSDFSANKPALPNIGVTSFTYTPDSRTYNLVATVSANTSRSNIDIENNCGDQILVLRDDGTAANSAAPVNASIFSLTGGSSPGSQGGSWSSTTFKGRIRVFAANTSAQISVMVD